VATTTTAAAAAAASASEGSGNSIDSVLQQIAEPRRVSTIEKSSIDWDNFKSKEQIGAELEQHSKGKGAYLGKQDFLNRVDLRKFEQEKAQREVERRKREYEASRR
jgi:hypothetical protein